MKLEFHDLSNFSHTARFRYVALQAHLNREAAGESNRLTQILHAHNILKGGFEGLEKFDPLKFEQPSNPDVSIIIPVLNNFGLTYYCLCALLFAPNDATFEVIVVDDGSSDETVRIKETVSGIKVLRNEMPQRFISACNSGAQAASGKYIVLLNNDTEPVIGWMDELIGAFERFDGVGLAGSKQLSQDGTLGEAGGIVWRTGNPWNYGRNANPWDPRFSYVRQADYLSGAAMMTTAKIWKEINGLSDYLELMYFEDTDFAFKVRDAGYKTLYVPHSIVYHFRGKTSGTDVSSGMKRFQEINRPKFKQRWAKAFEHFGEEGLNPDLEKDRGIAGRIAYIGDIRPPSEGDAESDAAMEAIKLIVSLGFKVTFIHENLTFFSEYSGQLQRIGVEIIHSPYFQSVNQFVQQRGNEFDEIHIVRCHIAEELLKVIRSHAPLAKVKLKSCQSDCDASDGT